MATSSISRGGQETKQREAVDLGGEFGSFDESADCAGKWEVLDKRFHGDCHQIGISYNSFGSSSKKEQGVVRCESGLLYRWGIPEKPKFPPVQVGNSEKFFPPVSKIGNFLEFPKKFPTCTGRNLRRQFLSDTVQVSRNFV